MTFLFPLLVPVVVSISVQGIGSHPNNSGNSVGENNLNDSSFFEFWELSSDEIQPAENVLVGAKNLSFIHVEENGNSNWIGVANEKKREHNGAFEIYSNLSEHNHIDFFNSPINLTYSTRTRNHAKPKIVVEILVVCDKEFGDGFQHNRRKIVDYLTVYFWDMNMRFKTLPSVDLSLRVTGVVVISTISDQPFIEEARGPDGKANTKRISELFSPWVNENLHKFPKFDISVAITNTNLDKTGGYAFIGAACNNRGSAVFSDSGNWEDAALGAHEIAHVLGAQHDETSTGCLEPGLIMNATTGVHDEFKWFFSACSDKHITEYVTSDQAACLRRIDESEVNPICPDFSAKLPPTMDEQCKRRFGPTAYVDKEYMGDCKRLRCNIPQKDGSWNWHSVNFADNSPCLGGGRCFRGRCRPPDFHIQNVGSGQCLKAPNPFKFMLGVEIADCQLPGTPFDRFAVIETSNGKNLCSPWQSVDAKENGEMCIWTGNRAGGSLHTDRRNADNPWHGWDFIDLGNNEFLLQHRITKRCAIQVNNGLATYQNCDRNDKNMIWKLQE